MMFTIAILSAHILAWGTDGHAIVGSIAESFLKPAALAQINQILANHGKTLGTVASWADSVKRTSKYAYTSTFHYVDIKDLPPSTCGFDESRDCADGKCILGAIATNTKEAKCGQPVDQQLDAVRFLTHWLGDIVQPLHTSSRDRGGNNDKIYFNGKQVNFHSLWDTPMVTTRMEELGGQEQYSDYLVKQIRTGSYESLASSWISLHSIDELSPLGNSKAAIDYATDSDILDCDGVWDGYDSNPHQDFGKAYYQNAVPILDIQLAKGGYRLAQWFNDMYEHC